MKAQLIKPKILVQIERKTGFLSGLLALDERETIFSPSDFIKNISKNRGCELDKIRVPTRLLVTYHTSMYEHARELIGGKPVDWWPYGERLPICMGSFRNEEIGAIRLFVGAPAAVMTLEELIACNAKIIFEVGLSGGLQPFLRAGSIVVITEAVRDEGTSHHYLPPKEKSVSSERLRSQLIHHLNERKIKHSVGSVWSTDGVYRETRSKFRKFRKAGVLCVDMETSAIFALAKYRSVEAASAQIISDILTESEWQPHFFKHQAVKKNTEILVETVLKALSSVS